MKRGEITLVKGDFNAKVCNGIEDGVISNIGLGTRNERVIALYSTAWKTQ